MDQPSASVTAEDVREALHDVIDPELGFNIVDLGLIYEIGIEGGIVDVAMTMTTPGCPAEGYIVSAVEQRSADIPGVSGIFVNVVWTPPWSPKRMSPLAKAHFQIREDAE
ncbi:MAG: metal-sulfur cluster assembly factor [Acetobacteraceae bacterium]